MSKIAKATENVGGGRKEQLLALQEVLTWKGSPPTLTKPLLCFLVPTARYLTRYKTTQQYTKGSGGRYDSQVCDILMLSSAAAILLL